VDGPPEEEFPLMKLAVVTVFVETEIEVTVFVAPEAVRGPTR
jgi:hypothetical protein